MIFVGGSTVHCIKRCESADTLLTAGAVAARWLEQAQQEEEVPVVVD